MTNTVTYTPGPWDCDLDYIVAPDPNGRHPDIYIAEIADSDDEGRVASIEQQHANRQLITAAPELLEALEYVTATLKLRHIDEASDDEVEEALHIGQKAIANAKAA